MFEYAGELNGGAVQPSKYYIPTATALDKGALVLFTPGTGVAAVAGDDFDDPALGAMAVAHPENSGTEAFVYDSPDAVYRLESKNVITATGGSTTTFLVAGLLPQTNNLWVGGYLKIISCAADPSLNGKLIKITASTGATGTLTFATQKAAFALGDTAYLTPGELAIGEYGWDLETGNKQVDWDTSGGEAIQLVGVEPDKFLSFWKLRLHQKGNDAAAK